MVDDSVDDDDAKARVLVQQSPIGAPQDHPAPVGGLSREPSNLQPWQMVFCVKVGSTMVNQCHF